MSTRLSASHRGASWLTEDVEPEGVLTPEKVSSEHRLIAQTATEFVTGEVLPRLADLERKDWSVARHLMMRCGELGLIGADVPEEYGGVALDKAAAVIVADRLAQPASFGATFGGQANLAVLPLLLVGTEAQKQRYIPRLLTGELIGAYALSESGSGSDALGARARASRQADGSYLLSGEKMWITNGGFADLFIVFAKVDGEHFTAFLVERAFRGVATGQEEHKMGLDGSSTTSLVLSDVVVPPENLLGEIGRGHKVAFNVLNYGRLKLGAMCAGGARQAVTEAARYAADRRQFGRPIASFGAIKHKLGEMTIRTYALESLLFRTAGLVDAWLSSSDDTLPDGARLLAALEEFAVEASIAKVEGSETLDYVLDENVQIHGGNGFVRDYPAERYYRDARVNRIFEGTNEINRLLIPTLVARRAAKGDLELHGPHAPSGETSSDLSQLRFVVSRGKDATLRVLQLACARYENSLADEQEVLSLVADMMIDVYSAESALLRSLEAERLRLTDRALHRTAARAFVADAGRRLAQSGGQALAAICTDSELDHELGRLDASTRTTPVNTVVLRRQLADETVARGGYLFPLERCS